jgi:hypothetical protein
MISKKTFKLWIESILKRHETDRVFGDALRSLNKDNNFVSAVTENFHIAQERLMDDLFSEDGVELINWWMYECGLKNTIREDKEDYIKPLIYDMDGNIVADLTEIEDLYDYVIGLQDE